MVTCVADDEDGDDDDDSGSIRSAFIGSAILIVIALFYHLILIRLIHDDQIIINNKNIKFDTDRLLFDIEHLFSPSLSNYQRPHILMVNRRNYRLQLIGDEWRFMSSSSIDDLLNCSSIWNVFNTKLDRSIGEGWSKTVYANSKYAHLALKTLNIDGIAIRNCQSNHNIDYCRQLEAMKFIREIAVIIDLQGDPTVPQLHGYCIPRDPSSSSTIDRLATVTEIGEPLLVVRLVQIDWIDRLRLIESIANFVNRLRPRLLLDLRRQQFVTVDDRELRPICVDFDDIAIIGYETNNDYCSRIGLCIDQKAEQHSVDRLYSSFIDDLLAYGIPLSAQAAMNRLISDRNANLLTIDRLLDHLRQMKSSINEISSNSSSTFYINTQ